MGKLNVSNRTIFCGDNLDILRGINSECIDLIYLDPPFNKKKHFTSPIGHGAEGASFKDIFREEDVKEEWLGLIADQQPVLYEYLHGISKIGHKSNKYYLCYMAIRLLEMHRILKPNGSLYFHCDQTMSHYIKLLLDCIFEEDNFKNEIVWHYGKWSNVSKYFQRNHDIIFLYNKSRNNIFNPIYIERRNTKPYHTNIIKGKGQLLIYDKKRTSDEIIKKYKEKDYSVVYVERQGVNAHDTWSYLQNKEFNILNSQSKERKKYPTQKPVSLLERIIKASSNKNDMVLDPFCGCATTCIAAERLERRWVGIDVSEIAYKLVNERIQSEIPADMWRGEAHMTIDAPKRTDRIKKKEMKKSEIKHILFGMQEGYCNGCKYQFEYKNLTLDHIIPQVDAGSDDIENLQLLCGHCNSMKSKGDMPTLINKLKGLGFINEEREKYKRGVTIKKRIT